MSQFKVTKLFETMSHCLLRNFSFFENEKLWVGRTTLNREKKGDRLKYFLVKKKKLKGFIFSLKQNPYASRSVSPPVNQLIDHVDQ